MNWQCNLYLHKTTHEFSKLLRRCVLLLPRKCLQDFSHISCHPAGYITLYRGQYVACEVRVERAWFWGSIVPLLHNVDTWGWAVILTPGLFISAPSCSKRCPADCNPSRNQNSAVGLREEGKYRIVEGNKTAFFQSLCGCHWSFKSQATDKLT